MLNDAPVWVSVVVPTRRRPAQLHEALASIRAIETPQLSFEILVCDNGGGEGEAAARKFGATYLTVDRLGAAAARNAGVLAATSEYLAFLDDDDLWVPGHISSQIAMLRARPELDAVVGQTITTDEMGIPFCEPWPEALPETGDLFQHFLREYPQIGATVVRTAVRESVGLFNEALMGDEDWDWHLRLALKHQIGFVPVPGVLFRQRPVGSFDDVQWTRMRDMRRVLFRTIWQAGSRRPAPRECLRLTFQHHWKYYWYFVESACRHLADGDRQAAWHAVFCAVGTSPVHVTLGLGRDRLLRQVLGALTLGLPAPRPNYGTADEAPVVLAPQDRPDPADGGQLAAYPAPSDEWTSREATR